MCRKKDSVNHFYFCVPFLFASFIKIISTHRFVIKVPSMICLPLSPTQLCFYTTGSTHCTSMPVFFLLVTTIVPFSRVYLEAISVHKEFLHSFLMAA